MSGVVLDVWNPDLWPLSYLDTMFHIKMSEVAQFLTVCANIATAVASVSPAQISSNFFILEHF